MEVRVYGLETIKAMNAEAADKARVGGEQPARLVHLDDVDAMPPFPFPRLGDACADFDDQGWTRLDSLWCDSSGLGAPNEPALTIDQLKERLRELITEHGVIHVAIEEAGQFQISLAVWTE